MEGNPSVREAKMHHEIIFSLSSRKAINKSCVKKETRNAFFPLHLAVFVVYLLLLRYDTDGSPIRGYIRKTYRFISWAVCQSIIGIQGKLGITRRKMDYIPKDRPRLRHPNMSA